MGLGRETFSSLSARRTATMMGKGAVVERNAGWSRIELQRVADPGPKLRLALACEGTLLRKGTHALPVSLLQG